MNTSFPDRRRAGGWRTADSLAILFAHRDPSPREMPATSPSEMPPMLPDELPPVGPNEQPDALPLEFPSPGNGRETTFLLSSRAQ